MTSALSNCPVIPECCGHPRILVRKRGKSNAFFACALFVSEHRGEFDLVNEPSEAAD